MLFLLVRDGTWAFILIFGSGPLSALFTSHLKLTTSAVTLCVNAGFYLGEGNNAMSSVAFPWLLSIEAFAGARLVLNLHALPFFDESGASREGADGAGTLSSHIVFMSNPAASTHHAANVRWDWGGLQRSYESAASGSGSRSGEGSGSGSGTRVVESYEMTCKADQPRRHCASTSLSGYTSQCSETCVDADIEGRFLGYVMHFYGSSSLTRYVAGDGHRRSSPLSSGYTAARYLPMMSVPQIRLCRTRTSCAARTRTHAPRVPAQLEARSSHQL